MITESISKVSTLDERNWTLLLQKIKSRRCTPFLGSESSFGAVPAASEIAREWSGIDCYPLEDSSNLARVSQFLGARYDSQYPKLKLRDRLNDISPPSFADPLEPHRILASLPLSVYVTTNYHDLMVRALKDRNRDPRQEICPWYQPTSRKPSVFESGYNPDPANPIVYHLFGHFSEPESLVLTEDDYLDFLVNTAREAESIPFQIQEAFTNATLLFLGYRPNDLDFRVLLRSLANFMKINRNAGHVSVQLITVGSEVSEAQFGNAREYLDSYCKQLKLGVYWGTSREFLAELWQRWEKFNGRS